MPSQFKDKFLSMAKENFSKHCSWSKKDYDCIMKVSSREKWLENCSGAPDFAKKHVMKAWEVGEKNVPDRIIWRD